MVNTKTYEDFLYPLTSTLIIDKTKSKKIIKQCVENLKKRGCDVNILCKCNDYKDLGFNKTNLKNASLELSIFHGEIMRQCKHENNITRTKVLIIDNVQDFLSYDDYFNVNMFQTNIESLLRLSHNVNLYIICILDNISCLQSKIINIFKRCVILGTNDDLQNLLYVVDKYDFKYFHCIIV